MRLYEYQGKELFKKFGINVPRSYLIRRVQEIDAAFDAVGFPAVLKSQVLIGGRGKAGGVAVVRSREEGINEATRILALPIRGETPVGLLVEQASEHRDEMYLSTTLDRSLRSFVMIASKAGGVEVESLQGRVIEPVPIDGLSGEAAVKLASRLGLTGRTSEEFAAVAGALERLSREEECELAEINPLAVMADGGLIALDSKLILDENALFRHPEFLRVSPDDPLESEAAKEGFAFVRLDGDIAVVGNGAGLVLSTLDLVADAGGRPACFLDLGGGSPQGRVEAALKLVRKLPNARQVLVNIFGGITRTTDVAAALKRAVGEGTMPPVYARISGAEEDAARRSLADTKVKMFPTATEAVRAAVAAAASGTEA